MSGQKVYTIMTVTRKINYDTSLTGNDEKINLNGDFI